MMYLYLPEDLADRTDRSVTYVVFIGLYFLCLAQRLARRCKAKLTSHYITGHSTCIPLNLKGWEKQRMHIHGQTWPCMTRMMKTVQCKALFLLVAKK
jgi:hypothetical protein